MDFSVFWNGLGPCGRFLNRQRDYKDGKNLQLYAQSVDTKLRDDIERLKKIRNHRGLRHYWCVKVLPPGGLRACFKR